MTNYGNCSDHANCTNTDGSFTCECLATYADRSTGDVNGTVCGKRFPRYSRVSWFKCFHRTDNRIWASFKIQNTYTWISLIIQHCFIYSIELPTSFTCSAETVNVTAYLPYFTNLGINETELLLGNCSGTVSGENLSFNGECNPSISVSDVPLIMGSIFVWSFNLSPLNINCYFINVTGKQHSYILRMEFNQHQRICHRHNRAICHDTNHVYICVVTECDLQRFRGKKVRIAPA